MDASQGRCLATAARMDEAFLSLLGEKEYPYITVKEICAWAGVNRSTFYLHYETIEDLLSESVTHMNQEFMGFFGDEAGQFIERLAVCPLEELDLVTAEYLTPCLTFVRGRKALFRVAVEYPATLRADRIYERMYKAIFETILERLDVPKRDRAYLMAFCIQGIMAIVARWLEGDSQDPIEHVCAVIRQCVPRVQLPEAP
jgi:AcrR family transcriptional regulator